MEPDQDKNLQTQTPQPQPSQQPKGSLSEKVKGLGENLGDSKSKAAGTANLAKASSPISKGVGPAVGGGMPLPETKHEKERGSTEGVVDKTAGTAVTAGVAATGVGAPVAKFAGQIAQKIGVKKISVGLISIIAITLVPLIIIGFIIFYAATNPWDFIKKVTLDASSRKFAFDIGKRVLKMNSTDLLKLIGEEPLSNPKVSYNNNIKLAQQTPTPQPGAQPPSGSTPTAPRDDQIAECLNGNDQNSPACQVALTYITYYFLGGNGKVQVCPDGYPPKAQLSEEDTKLINEKIPNLQDWNRLGAGYFLLCRINPWQENGSSASGASSGQSPSDSLANGTPLQEMFKNINWDKVQYSTGSKEAIYKMETTEGGKKVIGYINNRTGQKVSVEDIKNGNVSQETQDQIADSMTNLIPIEAMLFRGAWLRKVNKESNIRFTYASSPDDEKFNQNDFSKVQDVERDKTLSKVKGEDIVTIKCDDQEGSSTNKPKDKYCKAIKKAEEQVKNQVNNENGLDTQNIKIDFPFPQDQNNKKDISATICGFYYILLSPDNIKNSIESRANASRRNGMKYLILADQKRAVPVNSNETKAIFQQVAGWANGAGYQTTVNGKIAGELANPESLQQRAIASDPASGTNKAIFDKCNGYRDKDGNYNFDPGIIEGIINYFRGKDKGSERREEIIGLYSSLKTEIFADSPEYFPGIGVKTPEQMTMEDTIRRSIIIASGAAATGTEFGPQNYNRQISGGKQVYNDWLQGLGGRFLSENEANQVNLAIDNTRRQKDKTFGIAYRIFDTNNIRSLVSKMAHQTITTPKYAMMNLAKFMANLASPIQSLISIEESVSYYGFGINHQASAANIEADNYFKLEDVGFSLGELNETSVADNAAQIESMAKNDPDKKKKFASWDKCMTEKITSKLYYEDPNYWESSKLEDPKACQELNNPNNDLAKKYRAYVMDYNITIGLQSLSNDEEDPTIYENSSGNGGLITGEAKDLAAKILNSNKFSFTTSLAKEALEATANGQEAPIEARCNTGKASAQLSPALLAVLLKASEHYDIAIGYLTNGCHSGGSKHYDGKAVDINRLNGQTATGHSALDSEFMQYLVDNMLPNGSGIGQKGCLNVSIPPDKQINFFGDTCNHLHIQVP